VIQVPGYPVPLWPWRKRETSTPRKIEPDADTVDNSRSYNDSWGGKTDSASLHYDAFGDILNSETKEVLFQHYVNYSIFFEKGGQGIYLFFT